MFLTMDEKLISLQSLDSLFGIGQHKIINTALQLNQWIQ
jgi:hypothetical protein